MQVKAKDLFFLVLLLGGSLIAFVLSMGIDEQAGVVHQNSIDPKSKIVESLVNQHLKITSQMIDLKERNALDRFSDMPKVGDRLWPTAHLPSKNKNVGVDFSSDPKEDSTYQDLNRHPKDYSATGSPHSVIQGDLARQEADHRQWQVIKSNYIRKFIENARLHGYQVKVNDDLVVESVRPLPASAKDSFGPGHSGAQ
jgi:hypothetical protein